MTRERYALTVVRVRAIRRFPRKTAASAVASSSALATSASVRRLAGEPRLGKRSRAPVTFVVWRHERNCPEHRPLLRAISARTELKEDRADPSARISPACQRSRSGSSRSRKKSTERTEASQAR